MTAIASWVEMVSRLRAKRVVQRHFDAEHYLSQHPDLAGTDPLTHYLGKGWKRGLEPAPGFSPSRYLELNPDVRASGIEPFFHYHRFGLAEGRRVVAAAEEPTRAGPQDAFAAYRMLLGRPMTDLDGLERLVGSSLGDLLAHVLRGAEFEERVLGRLRAGLAPHDWRGELNGEEAACSLVLRLDVSVDALSVARPLDYLACVSAALGGSTLLDAAGTAKLRMLRDGIEHAGAVDAERERAEADVARRPRIEGIDILRVVDVSLDEVTGRATLTGSDPQIHLKLAVLYPPHAQACQLDIKMECIEGLLTAPRIYLDYGFGFSERHSLSPALDEEGRYRLILPLPHAIRQLRFDPSSRPGVVRFERIVASISDASLPHVGAETLDRLFQATLEVNGIAPREVLISYSDWIAANEQAGPAEFRRMAEMEADFTVRPKFSFVMPTYNTPPQYLTECLQSLLNQNYLDFEICIADDNSSNAETRAVLAQFAERDSRIKVAYRAENGHISAASNTALSLATGDFVVLVDHDDLIPAYTLWTVAYYLNLHPTAKVLFSDEDKISVDGVRSDPYFKSDFNQFLMYGHNMVSHLGVYARELVEEIGGFRQGYEGSQDYDLFLRCLDACGADKIVHMPHVLYHWRMIPGSTSVAPDQKSYAAVAAGRAIQDHFNRRELPLLSVETFAPGITGVDVVVDGAPETSVSIIIPTRDGLEVLKPCIESFFDRLGPSTELIVMDNGSVEPDTLDYLDQLTRRCAHVRVIRHDAPFNYSELNNLGVEQARGEIVCLLNNDTEALGGEWLRRARGLLSISEVGVVGARLAYPDGTLQHFGIYVGTGPHRVASTPHVGRPIEAPGPFTKARLIQEFSAVTGACLFTRKAVFEQVGGLETELKVAYNDVDFCLKVRRLGLKVVCDPGILLIHKESKTRGSDQDGEKAARLDREAEFMRARWGDVLDDDPYFSPNFSLDMLDYSPAVQSRAPLPWLRSI